MGSSTPSTSPPITPIPSPHFSSESSGMNHPVIQGEWNACPQFGSVRRFPRPRRGSKQITQGSFSRPRPFHSARLACKGFGSDGSHSGNSASSCRRHSRFPASRASSPVPSSSAVVRARILARRTVQYAIPRRQVKTPAAMRKRRRTVETLGGSCGGGGMPLFGALIPPLNRLRIPPFFRVASIARC